MVVLKSLKVIVKLIVNTTIHKVVLTVKGKVKMIFIERINGRPRKLIPVTIPVKSAAIISTAAAAWGITATRAGIGSTTRRA